jgi:hypothetical protein
MEPHPLFPTFDLTSMASLCLLSQGLCQYLEPPVILPRNTNLPPIHSPPTTAQIKTCRILIYLMSISPLLTKIMDSFLYASFRPGSIFQGGRLLRDHVTHTVLDPRHRWYGSAVQAWEERDPLMMNEGEWRADREMMKKVYMDAQLALGLGSDGVDEVSL